MRRRCVLALVDLMQLQGAADLYLEEGVSLAGDPRLQGQPSNFHSVLYRIAAALPGQSAGCASVRSSLNVTSTGVLCEIFGPVHAEELYLLRVTSFIGWSHNDICTNHETKCHYSRHIPKAIIYDINLCLFHEPLNQNGHLAVLGNSGRSQCASECSDTRRPSMGH